MVIVWRCPVCSPHFLKEHSRHAPALLDNDREIHPLVDKTIEVIGTRSGKWPDLDACAIDLHVVDGGRARLVCRCGCAMLPGAIRENMGHSHVIHQQQPGAFDNSDRRLREIGCTHMHRECLHLREHAEQEGNQSFPSTKVAHVAIGDQLHLPTPFRQILTYLLLPHTHCKQMGTRMLVCFLHAQALPPGLVLSPRPLRWSARSVMVSVNSTIACRTCGSASGRPFSFSRCEKLV